MNQLNLPNIIAEQQQTGLQNESYQEDLKQQNLWGFGQSQENNVFKKNDFQSTINFELVLQYYIGENCYAMDFDTSLSLIIIGDRNGFIQLFKFQSNKLKKQKIVKGHRQVICIVVLKHSNQFISSGDKIIKIWSFQGTYLRHLQYLSGHSRPVRCILVSHHEDLIVSGGNDCYIKFWIRKDNICNFDQQLLEHENWICGMSLNESQNQLISTAWEEPLIKISQQQPCKTWIVIQTIQIDIWGARICFLNNEMFSFQPFNGQSMQLYQFQSQSKVYTISKTLDVQQSKLGCTNLFPSQFIKEKQILVKKNGQCVNIISIKNNNDCILQQQLEFDHYCVNGSISHDGQYLITWDLSSSQIQIRQLLNYQKK
ncbi:unnamed protein product [Paramecium octaurelia]|uniref:Uncharacterized protein n=1 Tax=Paramecium octaurelia TaxID=43137 RepID=A0A8S1TE62_PAROT|nr:unnamed protein product [Paramecium octaurelia]